MLPTLFILILTTCAGTIFTYCLAVRERLLWRVAAGNIIGAAIFGLLGFTSAGFFGFTAATILVSLFVSLAPLLLLTKVSIRKSFAADWRSATKQLDGTDGKKILAVCYYAFFLLLFWLFFDRAMLETTAGIFTGASNNLGDLPFHLGAIFGFTDGNNFPPQNPSFAGARFSYPFMADFLTACAVKLGAPVAVALFAENVAWAFSLLIVLENFVHRLTGSRAAGKIAPALLFFSGGLGFLWFAKDFWQSGKGFFDFLMNLPTDYTMGDNFRWSDSLTTLFITQRSLLLGMPLTLIVLQKLWETFRGEKEKRRKGEKEKESNSVSKTELSTYNFPFSIFFAGLLAGTLPLIHLHSLAVLFVFGIFLFVLKPEKWRAWLAFGIGTILVAVPELVWAMSGSATKTAEFIAYYPGWDKGKYNFFWFWLKNTGVFFPLLLGGIYLVWKNIKQTEKDEQMANKTGLSFALHLSSLLEFYLPFLFCFIISNVLKLAPWQWDNIKILIYWWVGSIPFVALALIWLWRKNDWLKAFAVGCFIVLTAAGALDVWRVASKQINYRVFDADAVKIAAQIKDKTAPNALFLNAPTYNTAVVLSGRRSLMRYIGHLSSHGIDYRERENDLKDIYAGEANADDLLRKYGVEYVLISPEESKYARENALTINERFFQKYPLVAEAGEYRVYQVK